MSGPNTGCAPGSNEHLRLEINSAVRCSDVTPFHLDFIWLGPGNIRLLLLVCLLCDLIMQTFCRSLRINMLH